MRRFFHQTLGAATLAVLASTNALAVIPYSPVPVAGVPTVGPGILPPPAVYGKEYSHDFDFSVSAPALVDPQQIIAWDGAGGTADTTDYTGTRPTWTPDQEIDAIANHRDALFDETLMDMAHLVFSHDDVIAAYGVGGGGGGPTLVPVPSGGPVFLSNGFAIGGAGEVSIEEAGAFAPFVPSPQGVWATQPEVNGMPLPVDVDGTELWGPEPEEFGEPGAPVVGDADKYSLDVDLPSSVSIWNGSGTPYVSLATITSAVTTLLGPVPPTAFSLRDGSQGEQPINLDALMVSDVIGDTDTFDLDPIGPGPGREELLDQNGEPFLPIGEQGPRGDTIIFSIRQIVDPADPDGYYATGSELFVLDSLSGVPSFLFHGGHMWDHAYTTSALAFLGTEEEQNDYYGVIDINAIEAIGEDLFAPPVGLPGDFNGDGMVDGADYAIWRNNLGTGFPLSGNGDESGLSAGIVDAADLTLWRDNFGAMSPPSPLSAPLAGVPEPATGLLIALASLGMMGSRRR